MFPICIGQRLMDVPTATRQRDNKQCGTIITCAAAVPAGHSATGEAQRDGACPREHAVCSVVLPTCLVLVKLT